MFASILAIRPAAIATSRTAERFCAGSMTRPPVISKSYAALAAGSGAAWPACAAADGASNPPNDRVRSAGTNAAAEPTRARNSRRFDCDIVFVSIDPTAPAFDPAVGTSHLYLKTLAVRNLVGGASGVR